MINQLYWDLETTSKNTKFSSICSVHMELVNDTFQSLDKYSSFCSLRPGIIPELSLIHI